MRTRHGAALTTMVLLLAACGQQPLVPEATEVPAGETMTMADTQQAELAKQNCMADALNATIYKQQSDDALVTTMFAQNLDVCPADFKQAFVGLRQAARDYLPIANEVIEHAKLVDPALVVDGISLLCGIMRGEQCAPSLTVAWSAVGGELRQRAADAKARMDAAKDALEQVAAGHDVYARTAPPVDAPPQSPIENAM